MSDKWKRQDEAEWTSRDVDRAIRQVEARLRDESHGSIESAMVMKQNNWLTQENARLRHELSVASKCIEAMSVVLVAALIWAAVVTAVLVAQ